jgi:hypothetical protein
MSKNLLRLLPALAIGASIFIMFRGDIHADGTANCVVINNGCINTVHYAESLCKTSPRHPWCPEGNLNDSSQRREAICKHFKVGSYTDVYNQCIHDYSGYHIFGFNPANCSDFTSMLRSKNICAGR